MHDRIIESRPHIFIYKCEKNEVYYEIEIELQPKIELVTNFLIENHEIENFICDVLIEDQPIPETGIWYITGFEKIITNELSCINLYHYRVNIRLMPYPDDVEVTAYKEVEIMDFGLFLNYLDRN